MKNLILILFLLIIVSACHSSVEIKSFSGRTMGTTYSVKYMTVGDLLNESKLKVDIDKLLKSINMQMSTYIKDSELSLINYSSKKGPYSLSNELFSVIDHAINLAQVTNGAFDPTIGPLVNLWGFGPSGERKVPSEKELKKVLETVGYKKIALDNDKKYLFKAGPKVYIDLSASAKGYGVDELARLLESRGISNYIAEIGGEVKTGGSKSGKPWRIGIESPNPSDLKRHYQKVLNLNGQALATSGDYRNFFKEKGKSYSHTIDYKTGRPVEHTLASVSVLDKSSCMNADAWATALMALGPIKGLKLAEKEGIAAYFIYRLKGESNFQVKETSHLKLMTK